MTTIVSISGILMGTKDWPVKPAIQKRAVDGDGNIFAFEEREYEHELAAAKSRLLPVVEEQREMVKDLIAKNCYGHSSWSGFIQENQAYHLDVESREVIIGETDGKEIEEGMKFKAISYRKAIRITTPKA